MILSEKISQLNDLIKFLKMQGYTDNHTSDQVYQNLSECIRIRAKQVNNAHEIKRRNYKLKGYSYPEIIVQSKMNK